MRSPGKKIPFAAFVSFGRLGGFCLSLPYFIVMVVGKNISVGVTGMF